MPTVLITGCNRGIGLQLATKLKERGDDVIAVCRRTSSELADLGVRIIDGIDVSIADDVANLAAQLSGTPIDILIHNAGMLLHDEFGELNYDDMERQFRVNALGPLRITEALSPNLNEGAKIAIVSSRVGSIADNSSGGNWGYRTSKTAVNMIGTNLAHELRPRGIAVVLLHPGLVATEMTGGHGIATSESARGLIQRLDELTMENTGSFWHAEGYVLPW